MLFALIGTFDAAETNICTVSANPVRWDHRQLALEGIVAGLSKSTSGSGHKQMTFLLRSPVGCSHVIVYVQEPASLSNGDHLQVEGISKRNITEMDHSPRSFDGALLAEG